jgi:hypothetical protein
MSMFPEGPALREWRESLEAKGMAKGLAQGKTEAIFALLAARGVALDEADRERIATCTDLPTLDRWILRAANATDARGLFDEG